MNSTVYIGLYDRTNTDMSVVVAFVAVVQSGCGLRRSNGTWQPLKVLDRLILCQSVEGLRCVQINSKARLDLLCEDAVGECQL